MSDSLVVLPGTGELVDIATVDGARRGLVMVQEMRHQLTEFAYQCRETILEESDRRGQLSWTTPDGVKVRVGGATVEEEYDIAILHELIDAGLPEERWAELVTYEPRVDGRIIQQLKRNPTYAAVIELAVTGRKEKYRGVRFS
jgi:hypothetical protein